MGMSPNTGRNGKIKFLKEFTGHSDSKWPKDSIHNLRYWPDDEDKNVIWFNEGMGYWNSLKLGEDVAIV